MHVAACTYNQHQQNLHLRGNSSLAHGPTPSTISNAKGPHNEETMVVQLWPKHPSLPPPEGTSTGICRLLSDDLYDLCLYSFQCWMGVKISKTEWKCFIWFVRIHIYTPPENSKMERWGWAWFSKFQTVEKHHHVQLSPPCLPVICDINLMKKTKTLIKLNKPPSGFC